jgi:hypothetical protein
LQGNGVRTKARSAPRNGQPHASNAFFCSLDPEKPLRHRIWLLLSSTLPQLTAHFASDTINRWKLGRQWPGFLLARLCDNIHKVTPPAQNPR